MTVEVWLASPAQQPQLEAVFAAGDYGKLREFERTSGVVHLLQRAAKPIVPNSCPATRRADVYRVDVDAGGERRIVIASSELFDAAGKSVPLPKASDRERHREGALLLLVAGLGGSGLWRRRRRGDAKPA
jgi:hypothetical protein